jgi:hypothetical protein
MAPIPGLFSVHRFLRGPYRLESIMETSALDSAHFGWTGDGAIYDRIDDVASNLV